MDRDTLYFHFANLALVLIGLFSIQAIFNPFVFMILVSGTIAGFIISWQIKHSRPQHIDTFVGMLSLAAVVIILGRLYDTAITFENLLKIFSTALAWLTLFQSFGLKTGKSYAMLQFISVSFLISSVGLALAQEQFYIVLLSLYLFIFVFTMRLSLVCDRKRKGSVIIGDEQEVMSLWQQIKVGAIMFSLVLIVAALVYPFVPRFENLSLRWIPSTLLGIPEKIPLLKLLKQAPITIKEDKKAKKEQIVDDERKKREASGMSDMMKDKIRKKMEDKKREKKRKKEKVERFRAKDFNKNIDIFKIESVTIQSDKKDVPLDNKAELKAELKLNDGSTIPATRLVDWKVSGTAKVSIDNNGNLIPKEEGDVRISASYMGSFSNDIEIKITTPVKPVKKKSWLYYLLLILLWLLILALLGLMIWIFMKSKRLSELAVKNPRAFIKQIYLALCKGFRPYGVRRFDYLAHREFFGSVRGLVSSRPESMHLMTENVLEAGFSTHEISAEHSHKTLGLFHEVKDVVLQRQERKEFLKKILFRLLVLDVLLVPRRN